MRFKWLMVIIAISLAIGIPATTAVYSNGWNRIILLGDNALKFLDPIDFNNQSLGNIGSVCLGGICIGNWSQLNGTTFNITPTVILPAANISAGTFGADTPFTLGDYSFPHMLTTPYLNVTGNDDNATFSGDVQIFGKLYGGSPVKIAGGLNVTSGTANFGDIYVSSCTGCSQFNGTTNFSSVNVTNGTFINLIVTGNITFPNSSIIDAYIASLNANKLFNLSALNYQIQLSQANITSGIFLPAANISNGTFVIDVLTNSSYLSRSRVNDNVTIGFSETQLNATIAAAIAATTYRFLPTSVDVLRGTVTAGNLSSLFFVDGNTLNVTEVTGAVGQNIVVNFSNVTTFNSIELYQRYDGSAGHIWDIQLYNWNTATYDTFGSFSDEAFFTFTSDIVPNSSAYINSTNGTSLRLYHPNNGQASHESFWDYVTLSFSSGAVSSGVHGSGTSGTIPLWIGTSDLGNSALTQASGNIVTLNNITANTFFGKIAYVNVTGIPNATVYNESGIARNYTITGASLSGLLPAWDRIHISGSVITTTNSSILMNINNDSTAKYIFRRIQGLTFLYQAVTVNPQQNISFEQISSNASRDIDIIIYRAGSSISGEFSVTTYVNSTYGPYKTIGSFSYANTTDLTSFSLSPTFTAGSYLIVRSERQ